MEPSRRPLVAAALLQLALTGYVTLRGLFWLFMFPWENVGSGPAAQMVHALSFASVFVCGFLTLSSLALLRGRRWAWRVSWTAVRLTAVVLVVLPLMAIAEAPHGARLVEPLRMLAWGGPALLLAALLSAARGSVR